MTKNIVEFPDRKAVEKEAAEWLVRLDGDRALAPEELASLREWLGRSPVHREQLRRFADFWGKLNVLTELAVPLGQAKGRANRRFVGLRHVFPQFGRAVFVTAALVIGIGIAATFWLRPDLPLDSNGLYATAIGQQQSTTFPDGSVVLLNTNSQIKVDYSDEYRDIRLLQGEAHFTVAPNAARPFRVYAGHGRVQAVGTAFSVYLKGNTVDVTVTEGKVALASVNVPGSQNTQRLPQQGKPSGTGQSSGSIAILDSGLVETLGTIQAGESATIQGVFDADIASTIEVIETVEEQEMAKRQSWRDGVLTFAGDPLEVVVHEISRYTTVSIEFSDPAVKATRIGGRFPIGETDAMFDALEANFGLRVTRLSRDRVLVSVAAD
jgi:transmembrane sensor